MRNGKLFLVGLGPGAADQMTGRARRAIAEAEVVIGYAKYLDLIGDLLAGKEIVRKGMTQEVDRCVAACEQAGKGRTVALVSSGDIGVYGMAGLTYEVLFRSGWSPADGVRVEVIPGVTALSACASLVGAPLSHDFCAVSLSDLLTPWPVIARRLDAAARGDFVVALYNPRSGRRQGHLLEARDILLRHRRPDVPVAVVNGAYRERQTAQLSTLDAMTDCDVGMLSTVLIGNSSSYVRAGLMITPRGYSDKYADLTGNPLDGERSGRSLSMGLDGWKAGVRRYLRESATPSLDGAARRFGTSLGEILSAIAEGRDGDGAGPYSALTVEPAVAREVLGAVGGWGRLRLTFANGMGATCELSIGAEDLWLDDDRLVLEHGRCRLRIDWASARQAWLLRRSDGEAGLQLLDAAGDALIALSLERENGRCDAQALARYEQTWTKMLTTRNPT